MSNYNNITLKCENAQNIENELSSSELLKSILGVAPFGINLWTKDMMNIMCNSHILKIFNIESGEEFLERFFEFSPEFQPNGKSSEEMSIINFKKVLEDGKHTFHWMHLTPSGSRLPCEITLIKLDNSPDEEFVVGFIKDLRENFDYTKTEIKYDYYFTDKLPKNVLFEEMSKTSDEWFYTLDLRTGNIHYYGKTWFSGLDTTDAITESNMLETGFIHKDDLLIYREMLEKNISGSISAGDIRLLNDEKSYRYHRITNKLIYDDSGVPVFVFGKGVDVHNQRIIEERSQKDLLTDCYNKISAENIIAEKLAAGGDATHAFFIIDIDNFKAINDNLGHFFGDEVLRDISSGLKDAFRGVDIIARIGGDEFIVFVENLSDMEIIAKKAEMILEVYRKTYSGEYKDYSVSGSLGIALFPRDGANYEELYQNADKALNQAKIQGKNRYMVYSADLNIGTSERSTTKIENANRMASSFFDYDIISTIFNILYEKNGSSEAINLSLSYLCQKYGADRSYIFETLDDCKTLDNTFEYCKEGISSEINNLQGIPYELFADFVNKSHNDIIYTNDLRETLEHDRAFEIMDDQGILSFVHAQIKSDDKLTFFVGLDDCTKTRIWTEKEINSLQYIGKLLSIILQGTNLRKELSELASTLTTKLDDEHFLMNCVEMLHSGNEPTASIYSLLEAVADFYDAERSYIFEKSDCGKYISNTYEYCKPGSLPFKDRLQNLPVADLGVLLGNCEAHEVFNYNISNLTENSYEHEILSFQGITETIMSAIRIGGNEATGFVGVDNSKKNKEKTAIIKTVAKFIATFLDETEYVTKLNKLSYFDTLTGIKNRHSYGLALKGIDKDIDSLGVLYADILGLSSINDTRGAVFGDNILVKLADILRSIFEDKVFRVGGDEFVVLYENISEQEFERKVKLLKDKLSKEADFDTSIGYTWNKNFKKTNNDLADGETYGRILLENLEMEINTGKYVVYLQPQVTLPTGKVNNAEALVRRVGANGILQAPIYFLPFYEREGIILKIDEFVFETVCKNLKSWKENSAKTLPTISVNCSRMTISKEGIIDKLSQICDRYGVERSKIIIEITETINGIGENVLAKIIKKFSDAGFLVSLDDFGSGYSNLNSLVVSDFDEIKIDMSITAGMHKDLKSKLLTKLAIDLCGGLETLTSVAEGVENKLQHDMLCEMGCNVGQGYYYAKPMPIDEFSSKYLSFH